MDEAVIQGNFADIQNIKSRSVMVLKIEVPVEQAQKALNTLGYPTPGEEIPVAVVRLNIQKASKPVSYAQQAKMMAKDERVREFLKTEFTHLKDTGAREWSEEVIEDYCRVMSCAEIVADTAPGVKFKELQSKFGRWKAYNV